MKKLMFATALGVSVVGFGATAAPVTYNATSFEGYTADTAVVGTGGGDVGESGVGVNYFYYDGESDGSLVKAFGEVVAPTITRPYYWASSNNTQYLELSTEGGILWRSINAINTTDGVSLGEAQQVAADGTYLDTLVQFTPTEDGGAPELTSDDKLAIWLNVDSTTGATNLMVQTGYYDNGGALTQDPTNLVLTGKAIVAGEWYRLTVKAVDNILPAAAEANDLKFPGFKVYIDSVEMAATSAPVDPVFVNALKQAEILTQEEADDIINGKYLPSRLAGTAGTPSTLQGVGFKGSGALDDIVWTTEDPFANAGGDDAWIATVTQIFDGANLDAAEKAKITAWASENSIDVDTTVQGQAEIAAAAYLLGLDELPDAIPELTITSIEEGETAWTLTVAATAGDSALPLPATINGAITLAQAATLTDLGTATASTTGFTATVNGTVTVTIAKDSAAAKFMKVGVGLAPAANSGNE